MPLLDVHQQIMDVWYLYFQELDHLQTIQQGNRLRKNQGHMLFVKQGHGHMNVRGDKKVMG